MTPRAGGFAARGGPGRSSWSSGPPQRHSISSGGQSVSPTVPPAGPSGSTSSTTGGSIPTGPRAQTSITTTSTSSAAGAATASPSTPTGPASTTTTNKPFNPPTAPAAHTHHPSRLATTSLAQNLLNALPPLIPGGKTDPTAAAPYELDMHHRKMREEEERVREELRAKQDKLRKSLRVWDRLERESRGFELKSELSERSLGNIAGEGAKGVGY